jgi:HTH-type transcriptional regulator, glycine betaine synthesis regulator
MGWGVVHKVHRQGQRREFYRAETDVWVLFRRILQERKRRELDPTIVVLKRSVERIREDPSLADLESRIDSLRQFFGLINTLATRLLTLETEDLDELRHLLDPSDDPRPRL